MTAINKYQYNRPVSIAPLITFRIAFGLLMLVSILRFWWRGWITSVYVSPSFHFTYWGFDWAQPLGSAGMHILFAVLVLSTILITVGLYYRIAIITFFCCFTYVELIEITTYLNHYYFITLVSFIMIWLPCNRAYSLDAWMHPAKRRSQVPAWSIDIIRFQLTIVYVFAGLAKLNTDWLLHAEPMRTWLPAKSHLPIVGKYMYETWVAYLFSWFGAVYDLFIAFFLLYKKTRPVAYVVVVVFHIATAIFFPGIGMFPYMMIVSSLIFFSAGFHQLVLDFFSSRRKRNQQIPSDFKIAYQYKHKKIVLAALAVYIFIQLLVPLRFLFYPGHLFWTEEGYRFSWRVMLMEKSGVAYFTVKDHTGSQSYVVNNAEFLTPLQEKMMSTQPDMILKYAHFLAEEYKQRGIPDPKVFAEVYVALNGERSRLFIDTTVDLAAQPLDWRHYGWVLPYSKR